MVVVVALVVVLAVTFHPAARSGTNVVGTALAYSQTTGPARAAETNMSGGPWTLELVAGLGVGQSASGPAASAGLGFTGCTPVWSASGSVVAPATPSSAAEGEVAVWLIISENTSGGWLVTLVASPAGTVVATNLDVLTGTCFSQFMEFGSPPATVIDSPAAVASANAAGGSAFLSGHSVQAVELLILGQYWGVEYSTCSPYATSGSGSEWLQIVNDTTGATFGAPDVTTVTC